MKTLIIMYIIGAITIALTMEVIKLSCIKKPIIWKLVAVLLSVITDVSLFFGLSNELHIAILPFAIIVTYTLQYMIDQFGAKKIMIAIFNQYLVKHGYEKLIVTSVKKVKGDSIE